MIITKKSSSLWFVVILSDKIQQSVIRRLLIYIGHIQMHALTDTFFVTHPEKQSAEGGIHHIPETRREKRCAVPI